MIIADSGPLIAFAKIGGISDLLNLYPRIVTPPAVYDETVKEGQYAKAPDAAILHAEYEKGRLRIEKAPGPTPETIRGLGRGELESIHLALHHRAQCLLADDLEARTAAMAVFDRYRAPTKVKGTLGIIASSYLTGRIAMDRAIELLTAIRSRKDIWISAELCAQVEHALLQARK